LVLAGSAYDFGSLFSRPTAPAGNLSTLVDVSSLGFQEIRMNVTRFGWVPDTFVLRKGVPVKWVIDGQELTSCNNAIQVPKLGLKFNVKPGFQTMEFTPTEAGTIRWSCWMGMIQGTFIVKDDSVASPALQSDASTTIASVANNVVSSDSTGFQVIYMNVTAAGWSPNKFVLKTGVPVKWVVDGQELTGCNSGIQVPSLGLRFNIKPGVQVIEFTPTEAGNIQWSCLMGMIKGVFVVKDDINPEDQSSVSKELAQVQVPGSSGGCGCGGGLSYVG